MSEYSKILSACGWIERFEELPLVAERIARHSADRIEKLEWDYDAACATVETRDAEIEKLDAVKDAADRIYTHLTNGGKLDSKTGCYDQLKAALETLRVRYE